ncbi:FprA family A-type flavoprotein [Fuchsiella alkaliacetigena]|uniref:FprA family A-type flavoprotein n=1 Tax=Fuchsiella alkaliacetigena TaxID=957042 RepID=UPI002009E3E1|nr:FprA family A-type flavoprotein [Fuchsiella alkaliacetigena]MCK8825804.1 FprA family A-type flavoprotein [Fuchsiella alkaliacetigena]
MEAVKLTEDVYWVGAIDWNVRNFHGYLTQRGSTYNAYLIVDEKITLIDTVKENHTEEMLQRIAKVIDPAKIDYIISNHVEMDHSGGLPALKEVATEAQIVTSAKGKAGLEMHYQQDWDYQIVDNGDSLDLGQRSLSFALTPMVHWPDNMVSYLPSEKILFGNDAFGQHFADWHRFDDQLPYEILIEEAKKYFANIVLPYGRQVMKALEALSGLEIEMIAPSHGVIWRTYIQEIIEEYQKWASNETEEKAVIVYDSMWGSTEKLAQAVYSAFDAQGIKATVMSLNDNHISDIMTEVIEAEYICVGSPTLNNGLFPTVASFLTYLKGLAPQDRVGLAFGSYGWGGQSVKQVEKVFTECGFELLDSVKAQYIPTADDLESITNKLKGEL